MYAENYRRQYIHLYRDRKPLFLCPLNELGVEVTGSSYGLNSFSVDVTESGYRLDAFFVDVTGLALS